MSNKWIYWTITFYKHPHTNNCLFDEEESSICFTIYWNFNDSLRRCLCSHRQVYKCAWRCEIHVQWHYADNNTQKELQKPKKSFHYVKLKAYVKLHCVRPHHINTQNTHSDTHTCKTRRKPTNHQNSLLWIFKSTENNLPLYLKVHRSRFPHGSNPTNEDT